MQQLSNSTKTYIEEKSCTLMYSLYWLIAVDSYYILLFIVQLLMTCRNSNVIAYFKKEGEIASLMIGFILFVVSVTCSLIIYSSFSSITNDTMTVVGLLAIINIFVLAVMYLPKVSEC